MIEFIGRYGLYPIGCLAITGFLISSDYSILESQRVFCISLLSTIAILIIPYAFVLKDIAYYSKYLTNTRKGLLKLAVAHFFFLWGAIHFWIPPVNAILPRLESTQIGGKIIGKSEHLITRGRRLFRYQEYIFEIKFFSYKIQREAAVKVDFETYSKSQVGGNLSLIGSVGSLGFIYAKRPPQKI